MGIGTTDWKTPLAGFVCPGFSRSLKTRLFSCVFQFVSFCMPALLRSSPANQHGSVDCQKKLDVFSSRIPGQVQPTFFPAVQFFDRNLIVELDRLSAEQLTSCETMVAFCGELFWSVEAKTLAEDILGFGSVSVEAMVMWDADVKKAVT